MPKTILPALVPTSSEEEQDRMRGFARGANSYVGKTVDFNHTEAVRQLGIFWLLLNEPPPAVR
jgi:DNA-binding response OmpR family regulator